MGLWRLKNPPCDIHRLKVKLPLWKTPYKDDQGNWWPKLGLVRAYPLDASERGLFTWGKSESYSVWGTDWLGFVNEITSKPVVLSPEWWAQAEQLLLSSYCDTYGRGGVATTAIYALMLCVVNIHAWIQTLCLDSKGTVHSQSLVFSSFCTILARLVQVISWFSYL